MTVQGPQMVRDGKNFGNRCTIHSPYNKVFVKYQAQGGVNPKPPLRTPLALGPAPQGAPRHDGWAGCLFFPDTPCAREL